MTTAIQKENITKITEEKQITLNSEYTLNLMGGNLVQTAELTQPATTINSLTDSVTMETYHCC